MEGWVGDMPFQDPQERWRREVEISTRSTAGKRGAKVTYMKGGDERGFKLTYGEME